MAEYTITRIYQGWSIDAGDVTLDAVSPHVDRGQVRAVLTARNGETIIHRDTMNLTSERSRAKMVTALAEKGVTVEDGVLVALEDACRQPWEPEPKEVCETGGNFSEKVIPLDLAGLEAAFRRHLLITDRALLVVTAGAYLAHRLEGEPVWLLLVAPPGGTKTEILRAFYQQPDVYALSKLTPRTFASGLDAPGKDPSLLARLTNEVLVLKDLTTVLQMPGYDLTEIFATLREIYDGSYDMAWGTGKELHWRGRLGFMAGVTPIIDNHHGALSVMGERFVMLRTNQPNRLELARRALESSGNETTIRDDLQAAMTGFLQTRSTEPPAVSSDVLDTLATVADFVTRSRSGVVRNGNRRELEYAPEPEAPTRFAKVLLNLARGIALVHDREHVSTVDLGYVMRVAIDSLPDVRRRVITALTEQAITTSDGVMSTSGIAGMTQFSSSTIRRTLEDLQALRVVSVEKHGQGKADTWRLHPEWRDIFQQLGEAALSTFSEKLPPASQSSDARPSQLHTTLPAGIETDIQQWLADGTLEANRQPATLADGGFMPADKLPRFVAMWLTDLGTGGAPEEHARKWLEAVHVAVARGLEEQEAA